MVILIEICSAFTFQDQAGHGLNVSRFPSIFINKSFVLGHFYCRFLCI